MTRNFLLVVMSYLLVVLAVSSCGPQVKPNSFDLQAIKATAREGVRRTEAAIPTSTLTPTITETITPVYVPTEIPPDTATPTPSPTGTATQTPTAVPAAKVYMDGDTNCRSGPSSHYDWLGYILKGESAFILGRAEGEDYWLIENLDAEGTCWVWGGYATLQGYYNQVPNAPIPPTKTPTRTATQTRTPAARLYLEEVILCNGQETLVIKVYNSGRVDLRSYRMVIYAEPGRIEIGRHSSNQFSHDDQECSRTVSVLETYKTGYALAPFTPNGYTDFSVDVQACTGPGSLGGCVNDFFGFDLAFLTATPTYTPTFTKTPTPTATFTATPTTPTP